jgi:hypothetical protein
MSGTRFVQILNFAQKIWRPQWRQGELLIIFYKFFFPFVLLNLEPSYIYKHKMIKYCLQIC